MFLPVSRRLVASTPAAMVLLSLRTNAEEIVVALILQSVTMVVSHVWVCSRVVVHAPEVAEDNVLVLAPAAVGEGEPIVTMVWYMARMDRFGRTALLIVLFIRGLVLLLLGDLWPGMVSILTFVLFLAMET